MFEALKNGIKSTAKKFYMSKNTICLWIRQYQKEENDRFIDRRNGPNNIPHKTFKAIEQKMITYLPKLLVMELED